MFWTKTVVAGIPVAMLASGVAAQAGAYGQCGGMGWGGATSCVSDYHCVSVNPYYSQCTPGAAGPAGPTTTAKPTTAKTTTTSGGPTTTPPPVTMKTTTTMAGPTPTGSGTNPGSTLVSGWYYIRAVAEPNFHSYLQSKPTGLPSDAYMDSNTDAGQFNIVDGQLVYFTGTGGQLYMNVEDPADKTQRKLETWFATTENTYGAFAFQGDTVTWHVADIARPNEAAWLVCEQQQLFINTGAYAYMTPEGCSDQTIHYYGGSTANV